MAGPVFSQGWFSGAIKMLYEKDASLYSSDEEVKGLVADRLGWLDAPGFVAENIARLKEFGEKVRAAGFDTATLLGMGGSSLSSIVFLDAFGLREGGPLFRVLDTTSPQTVAQYAESAGKGLFLVASKSGTTLETLTHYRFFKEMASEGAKFVAITDEGSFLHRTAEEEGFVEIFLNPRDIGGRYSGLSLFGFAPAALLAGDITKLAQDGQDMVERCRQPDPDANPGMKLAQFIADNLAENRDKLTLITDPGLRSFGLWVEQLLAESLGKDSKGVIPVATEPMGPVSSYGDDRFFIFMGLGGEEHPWAGFAQEMRDAGFPILVGALGDVYDLGGEMFTWMVATALLGALLGVNPFDEPNVAESKANTNKVLEDFEKTGLLPLPEPGEDGFMAVSANLGDPAGLAEQMEGLLAGLGPGGFLGTLAYLPYSPETDAWAGEFRAKVMNMSKSATTFGYGPRYLHSTGQLFKGGPQRGSFLLLTRDAEEKIGIPDAGYGFRELIWAQALGDFTALADRKRPIVHLHLPKDHLPVLGMLTGMLERLT